MLKRFAIFACGFSVFSISNRAQLVTPPPSEPTLAGSWQITFYLEPNHSQGATQCVTFTTTTEEGGEELSGRWTSSTFFGWQGDWRKDGDHIQWYGFTQDGLATSEFGHLPSNTIISGEFNHFISPMGTTSTVGGWVATRVSGCVTGLPESTAPNAGRTAPNADPAAPNADPAAPNADPDTRR